MQCKKFNAGTRPVCLGAGDKDNIINTLHFRFQFKFNGLLFIALLLLCKWSLFFDKTNNISSHISSVCPLSHGNKTSFVGLPHNKAVSGGLSVSSPFQTLFIVRLLYCTRALDNQICLMKQNNRTMTTVSELKVGHRQMDVEKKARQRIYVTKLLFITHLGLVSLILVS